MSDQDLKDFYNLYANNYSGSTPFSLSVESLQIADIPAFMKLQKTVCDALPAHQKHFLKPREEHDLIAHWEARMPILGIKDINGDLIAQALVAYPVNQDAVKNLKGYPMKEDDLEAVAATAIVQSLCVAPGMDGKGLAQMILDQAKHLAVMESHALLIAKVAQDNIASRSSFLKSGFTNASSGIDPKAGYKVDYLTFQIKIPKYVKKECTATSPSLALAS